MNDYYNVKHTNLYEANRNIQVNWDKVKITLSAIMLKTDRKSLFIISTESITL